MENYLKFLRAGKNFSVKNKKSNGRRFFNKNRKEHAVAYVFLLRYFSKNKQLFLTYSIWVLCEIKPNEKTINVYIYIPSL